jgi:hypothetical protein
VFENRVLRRIFGPKRDEMTGGWRKLHNEELRNLYSLPSINIMIKTRRWAGNVARIGETRNAHMIVVGKSEEKRSLGRPRRTCVVNIKMILERQDGVIRSGLILLRIGTSGGLL